MQISILKYKIIPIIFFFLPGILICQQQLDLVDITKIDSTIIVDLKYATADNFLGDTLYSANICLLRKEVAERLIKVHQYLKKQRLGLKIWDGYRLLSVQKRMWDILPNSNYVANPKTGSNHNRGAAVDVTLVDAKGNELEMPTGFDDFSDKAGSDYAEVSAAALKNRMLLQNAMYRFGFKSIKSEWWHFNDKNIKKYPVLDIPLECFIPSAAKLQKKFNHQGHKKFTKFTKKKINFY